ncbi:MAG: PEGA domain-containing protein [Treponema sp.]|nr:PEGA domain-containing protein [Treponema sp.]
MKCIKRIFLFLAVCLGCAFYVTAKPTPHEHRGDEHRGGVHRGDEHRGDEHRVDERAYIEVQTTPSGAAVYLDGRYEGTSPLRMEVRPDVSHNIEVSKPGYKNEKKNVTAYAKSVTNVSFYMSELPKKGEIKVSVTNASGCSVYLDGSYKGKAPLTIKDLSPGNYRVRISKSNFQDEQKTVTVRAGEVTKAEFSLKMGELRVHAPGVIDASVYVDGRYKGTTPYFGSDLEPGYHEVKVTKPHYKDWTRSVSIRSGYVQNITADLEKLAELYVRVLNTSGVTVYLNGRNVGSTPYHCEDLEGGYYNVKLVKKHYKTEEMSVYLSGGFSKDLNLEMTKISGYLNMNVSPSDATVTVDGESYKANSTLELDEGIHQVKVSRFGYDDIVESVEIIRDRYQSMDVSLSPSNFEISSFQVDTSLSSLVRFKWSVTSPGSGVISVRDSLGAEIVSWNVEFDSWNQFMEWDKKICGVPVESGSYTAVLSAGGFERTCAFMVNNGSSSYSRQQSLDSARERVDASMEKSLSSQSSELVFFSTDTLFASERNGLFFSLDCGVKSSEDYEFGGEMTLCWSPFPFTIFGAELAFKSGKNSSYPTAETCDYASAYVIAGLTCTFGAIRPYVYVGAGYCGYFSMSNKVSTAPDGSSSSDSFSVLANGLSLEIVPGIDFVFDKWSIGAFYRARNDMETGNYGSFGVSVGIDLW